MKILLNFIPNFPKNNKIIIKCKSDIYHLKKKLPLFYLKNKGKKFISALNCLIFD